MSSIFNESGHLTHAALLSLKSGSLSDLELYQALDHLSVCESCSSLFADSYDENELAEIPSGFTNEVKSKLHFREDNKRQLFFYSARVAIAACAAIAMVIWSSYGFVSKINTTNSNIRTPDLSFVDSINSGLNNFSQKILNLEVFYNEKEKK